MKLRQIALLGLVTVVLSGTAFAGAKPNRNGNIDALQLAPILDSRRSGGELRNVELDPETLVGNIQLAGGKTKGWAEADENGEIDSLQLPSDDSERSSLGVANKCYFAAKLRYKVCLHKCPRSRTNYCRFVCTAIHLVEHHECFTDSVDSVADEISDLDSEDGNRSELLNVEVD